MKPISENSPEVIGITGGVGAGKSMVLSYMEETYGALVIQADRVGHLVMEPDGSCFLPMVEHFGTEILDAEGRIDRAKVAAVVFSDEEELRWQTALIHPAVKAWIRERIEEERGERKEEQHPFVLVEAALLIEDHYEEICGEFWYLHAEEAVRRERLKASRGYSDTHIDRVMEKQQSEEVFRAACRFCIDNSGNPEETYQQIDTILREKEYQKIR